MAPVLLVCLVNVFNVFSSSFNFLGLQSMPAVYTNQNRFRIFFFFLFSLFYHLYTDTRLPMSREWYDLKCLLGGVIGVMANIAF